MSRMVSDMPSGQTVMVEVRALVGQVRVSVGNPGQGIAKEHLGHLFERFYRVGRSRARNADGTGLGLAIVQSIRALHQGAASVEISEEQVPGFTWISARLTEAD